MSTSWVVDATAPHDHVGESAGYRLWHGTEWNSARCDGQRAWEVQVHAGFGHHPGAGKDQTLSATFTPTDTRVYTTDSATATINVLQATSSFSGLTSSQSILSGTASISLAGTLAGNTSAVPPGSISITINGTTRTAAVQANGTFSATFDTHAIPASATPYAITYAYAANANFQAASNASTSLIVVAATITPVSPNPRNTPVSDVTVGFSASISTTSLTSADLSLTDNGGPNLIAGPVSLTAVAANSYEITGLSGLTLAQGTYKLTLNVAGIRDHNGNVGTGTISTSWLMDTTPPTSTVKPLAKRGTSLIFAVSVAGTDPKGSGGSLPSGVASYDIFKSTNGGPWTLWTTVSASSPSANFTGQSNRTYAFSSIAHDLAGNTESKKLSIEAITYLPDLTPPVTSVDTTTGTNPSSLNATTGTFTLNITGSDPGGGRVTYFEVFVSVDRGAYQEVGPYAIPAGAADGKGNDHSTIMYQGITDGRSHTYSFYSIGFDSAGNVQIAPSSPNVTFSNKTFAVPSRLQVTGFSVEHGSPGRSFVRYLDLNFNESDSQSGGELTSIINSISTPSPDIQIYKYDLNGDASSKTLVPLGSPTMLDVLDHAIEIDFGASGLGGNPNTTSADGYYEVDIKLPSGQTAVHHFYRLLGDITGDGVVDSNDLNGIAASIGQSTPTGFAPVSADVNGDASVTALDLTLATRSKGRKLASTLSVG